MREVEVVIGPAIMSCHAETGERRGCGVEMV